MPFEIIEITDHELSKKKFVNECTAAYIGTVRQFVVDHVAHRLAQIRRARGMFDALQRSEEWDEHTDLTMGAPGKDEFSSSL